MSKFLKILLLSLLVFSLGNIYYADANYDKERLLLFNSDILQELLTQRTEIMNEGIYNCNNMDLVIEKLKAIEIGDILENDILYLESINNNPTDFPKVKSVNVIDISKIKFKEDTYDLISDIEWNILYDLEDVTEEYKYFLRVRVKDNKFYLTELEPYE